MYCNNKRYLCSSGTGCTRYYSSSTWRGLKKWSLGERREIARSLRGEMNHITSKILFTVYISFSSPNPRPDHEVDHHNFDAGIVSGRRQPAKQAAQQTSALSRFKPSNAEEWSSTHHVSARSDSAGRRQSQIRG